MELIGAALKRRRLRLGLTQMDLERMTGIDQSVISRIERARRWGLAWPRFAMLVDALGGLDFEPDPPRAGRLIDLSHQRLGNPYLIAQAQRAKEASERPT
jgi:transcriptional regulator with XRE-family HTH domain